MVLLSTNPATADTLRPFKYDESCIIVKRSLLSTEEACDILVDIHDCQCLITVKANTGGQVKEEFTQRFEVNGFSKTYELFGSTILMYA